MCELIHETFPGYVPGALLGFNGEFGLPKPPLMPFYEDGVSVGPRLLVQHPQYEQFMAMIMEMIVAAGYCGPSGPERFSFIESNNLFYHQGDAFDENSQYINHDVISTISDKKVSEFYDYFPLDTARCFLRFAERANSPRATHTQDPILIGRLVRIELGLKVFFGRIGYPEFSERHIPRGFLILEEAYSKRRLIGG